MRRKRIHNYLEFEKEIEGKMKKTIVLCSYNGEKFITEQLDSLKNQTVAPDEVIIYDDCSTDQTVPIIKDYIQKYQLDHWHVKVNEKNQGWKINFIRGLKEANGDIIFPCDQDDIWNEDKIEKMSAIMEQDEKVQVLAANYEILYEGEEYQKISDVFSKEIAFDGKYHKVEADEKGVYIMRPGCVMALRKTFIDYAMNYYFENYPHDALFWRTAVFCDGLYLHNYAAIKFRRHGGNASDAKKHTWKEKYESVCYYIKVIDYLMKMTKDRDDIEKTKILERTRKVWVVRKRFYETGNPILWMRLLMGYKTYYLTLKAVLGDLYLVIRKKG